MYQLRSFHLRDMTACGAALRRLGVGAKSLEEVAERLVRYLYASFTMPRSGEPACVLVRLFKTVPYYRLTPDLQSLAIERLGETPDDPSLTCLTLLASAGAVPGWNDPSLSSRFRVIPFSCPHDIEQLPMFSQLFHQLGWSLSHLTTPRQNLLLDSQERTFNVFHILQAEGSPYVPAQEEFVRRYGVRSVLGFGAPLPDGELFSVILFSKDVVPESTAQLFKPLALCAQIALAPHAAQIPLLNASTAALPDTGGAETNLPAVAPMQARMAELEQLLTVHEQTVETQADRIEMIVRGAGVGTWDWDIPTGHVTFNEQWATMLGYHLADLDPHIRTWDQLVHPDDQQAMKEAVSAHLRGETPVYSNEYRLRTKSGAWQWVFDSGRVLLRDATGAPLRAAGIHLDISDRKRLEEAQTRAQQEVREKQQALDDAQALAHLGSWEWQITTEEERWSNEQYRIFGFEPGGVVPCYDTFLNALHADDKAQVLSAVAAALDGRTPYSVECRIIRPTGEVRHVHCRGVVIRDSDGQPMKMAGTVLDVTERKQVETALRESEARVRSIFEQAVEGIVVIDETGRIENVNPALLTLLGYDEQELLGQNITRLMPSPHRENHGGYLGTGRELSALRKDGTPLAVHLSVSEMRIETSRKFTGMIRDISERKRMEEALRQSEERFRQLAEHIDAVFWLTSADKNDVLYVSPAFETVWGHPCNLLYARPMLWVEQVHQEDRERVHRATLCQPYFPYDEEYRIVTPDGTVRWIRDRSFPIKDHNGEVYRLAGIAEDITATKRMAEALRNSEARYRSLVELSPNAVLVTCDGIIVYANQACLNLVRASAPSELLKRDFFSLVPQESRPRFQARLADLTATGEALPSMEERFVRLDGTVIDIEIAAAAITFEGRPAIQRIVTDVTTRQYLEQALLSANRQLTAILDAATRFSVIATDTTGMVTTFNKGAEELLGYSAEELLGKHSLNILHLPAEVEQRSRQLSELYGRPIHGFAVFVEQAKQGGYDEREWTYRRKDGSHLTVSVTVTALRNENGSIVGFLAVGKDVTQRKEAETALARAAHELEQKNIELAQARDEALRAVQLKADFLATMSHEIRTPMNAIIGMTGLLLETTLTEDQREFANTVRSSGDALLTLVNDILDFSKIEAGKLHFEEIAFDLRTTVEDMLDLLAEQAQGKGLELIGLVDAAVPTCVLGDPGRLRQILVNLVGNAIKFTSAGEVFLHVTRDEQDGSNLLRFTITDTGIGIPQEAQTRLFEAFVQADSSTTRRYGGTGLGLAICERLVTQMQGRIGIESRQGQGSTFWFTARLPETAITALLPTISRRRLHGQRILLVAQNHRMRNALHQQLTAHGMDCAYAANGTQAVEMAHAAAALRRPFGLALIELHLPEMDGFETAALLKQDQATAALRLVILTPVGRRGADARAQAIGIDAYLTKPLRQTQLLDCLCLLLGNPVTAGPPDVTDAPPLMTRQTPVEAQPSPTARLLLVEDNPVNQKVAIKMLEKLGYRVDVAGNGQEAVAAHERSPYPLIFMDCQMPEMDGFEATRLIRKREQAHGSDELRMMNDEFRSTASPSTIHHSSFNIPHSPRRVPIIAMTANAMQGDRERCLAAGMDDYVAKPIRSNDLQAIIETWLLRRPKAANS